MSNKFQNEDFKTEAELVSAGGTKAQLLNTTKIYSPKTANVLESDLRKNNDAAIVAPAVTNDSSQGYEVGSRWVDTVGQKAYVCISATTGAAIWKAVGGGLTAWVTATDYVVDDVVIESNKIYQALTSHTSGVFATDLASGDWVELAQSTGGAGAPSLATLTDVAINALENKDILKYDSTSTKWVNSRITPDVALSNWNVSLFAPVATSWYASVIHYANGLFVALATGGTSNRILTSVDGVNWTVRVGAADLTWKSLTYGAGLWVAMANGGGTTTTRIHTSPDGITWTIRTHTAGAAGNKYICFYNGLFLSMADSGSPSSLYTSPDGYTWTSRPSSGIKEAMDITYGNGNYWAIGHVGSDPNSTTYLSKSTDGITWTYTEPFPANTALRNIVFANNVFIATHANYEIIYRSTDGITWTKVKDTGLFNRLDAIVYGNNVWVIMSTTGTSINAINPMYVSYDNGLTWIESDIQTSTYSLSNSLTGNKKIIFARNQFVALAAPKTGPDSSALLKSLKF